MAGHDYVSGIDTFRAVNDFFGKTHAITVYPDSSWVIKKVLNTQMDDEARSDTLKFITNTIYSFNGVQATYSIYSTPSGYKLNLNNTEWGHICGNLVDYNLTSGRIENRQFNDIFTGEFVIKIWMYKE